ncbi:DUF3017 domain-containing protein [Ornithinimicrobium sp. Arc0846-15]|nr:DUF3017 domain-containing protein [Ornithinimicrobium laminariae]
MALNNSGSRQPLGLWWLLPLGLAAACWMLLSGGLRGFGYTMAATLMVAAMVRLIVPGRWAGGLRVRSRVADVTILLVLASATTILTASLVIR